MALHGFAPLLTRYGAKLTNVFSKKFIIETAAFAGRKGPT